MGARRTSSPGPPNLMKVCPENIRYFLNKLMTLPQSPEYKKMLQEEENRKQAEKFKKHEYCDACYKGGEVLSCDKCTRSFHKNCHIPSVNKQPGVEWLCRGCSPVKNNETDEILVDDQIDEILIDDPIDYQAKMIRLLNFYSLWYIRKNNWFEIPIKRKYNNKLPARRQLDGDKLIRKTDRCTVCKNGLIKGPMVNCGFCSRLYHVNCLEIPVRDWDRCMRWLCPAHNQFFELVYPELYSSETGVLTNAMTMKRQRSELPSLPVNTSFNIPSNIDVLYKTPEEYIPSTSTKNSSLKMLCDVASLELESINSNQKINYDNNVLNVICAKFLASQRFNTLEQNNNLLCKQPKASLSGITIPMNISVLKKSLTIGKSTDSNICLKYFGNCDYISDNHATITFDDKLGDYLVQNHSSHGFIVDNVSYFGSCRPKDHEKDLNKINSHVRRFMNRRRKLVRELDDRPQKCASKKRRLDYKPLYKYYSNMFANLNHGYRNVPCKCSSRLLPQDGYAGQAVLRNGSILSIGCIKFKFTYETSTNEVFRSCEEMLTAKQDDVSDKPIDKQTSEKQITTDKPTDKQTTEEKQITTDKPTDKQTTEEKQITTDKPTDKQTTEEKQITTDKQITAKNPFKVRLKQPQSEQENGINIIKNTRNEPSLVTINGHCSLKDINDTNVFNEQNNISILNSDNSEDNCFSNSEKKINGKCDSLIKPNGKIIPTLNTNMCDTSFTEQLSFTANGVSNKMQSCFANDLIQEVNVLADDDGIIEEEFYVFDEKAMGWVIEGYVVDGDKNLQLSSKYHPIPNCDRGDYKTEHLYCAPSPSYTDTIDTIVISSEDEE